ncbi:MAG: hypothetical protein E7267_07150 [Lachnospiraceae bacterium]|nr:hypothetical protein [Lachnospiraceae bacterium]
MLKRMTICFALVLLVSFICGCNNKPQIEEQVISVPSTILENKENLGDSAIYYVPNETIEAGFLQNLSSFCGNLLVYGFSGDMTDISSSSLEYHIKLINPQTGNEDASLILSGLDLPNIQICGDIFTVTDWGNGKIYLYDKKLNDAGTYQVDCDYNSMYLNNDATKVYVFLPDEGLKVTDLASGETTTIFNNVANLYASNKCGSYVTFSYTDRKTQLDECCALNIETGEISQLPFYGAFYDVKFMNGTWIATSNDNLDEHYIGDENTMKTFKYDNVFSSLEVVSESNTLLLKTYDENGFVEMSLYDIQGKFVSKYENALQGADVQGEFVWSESDNGYFFLMSNLSEKDKLMFWDKGVDVLGKDLSFNAVTEKTLTEDVLSKETYERAKELGNKYGITVLVAEQIDNDYSDYKAKKMLDENQVNIALDVLDEQLRIYPYGFLGQLAYGSVRETEIHLAGKLKNLSQPKGNVNGFTSYSGFFQTRNGKAIIVLDVNEGENLAQYLHHELFHLINEKLSFDAQIRSDALYSEEKWMSLNPEGFEYAENTFELPDELYNEEYDLWFIDMYARTFSKEDRATIMQCAMLGDYNMFVAAPHRQAKLKYLNRCIRDAFDTNGWPKQTVWEKTLKQSKL